MFNYDKWFIFLLQEAKFRTRRRWLFSFHMSLPLSMPIFNKKNRHGELKENSPSFFWRVCIRTQRRRISLCQSRKKNEAVFWINRSHEPWEETTNSNCFLMGSGKSRETRCCLSWKLCLTTTNTFTVHRHFKCFTSKRVLLHSWLISGRPIICG